MRTLPLSVLQCCLVTALACSSPSKSSSVDGLSAAPVGSSGGGAGLGSTPGSSVGSGTSTAASGPAGVAGPAGAGPAGVAGPTEVADPTETAAPTETAGPTETAAPTETAPAETAEPAGVGGNMGDDGSTGAGGSTDVAEPAGDGGSTGVGGDTGAGGSTGEGGSGGSGMDGGNEGDVKPSAGCNVPDGLQTLTSGGMSIAGGLPTSTRLQISSGGMNREYIIDVPEDYDPTHPYRLIFSWHQAYGSNTGNAIGQYPAGDGPNFDAANYAYFGLHREAAAANEPVIFVAPGGIGNLPWDFTRDVALFDDLLALVDANLCIDDSRVFSTGFSFGAMMSYSLSITRQDKLRAVVTMAAANYNLPGQPTNSNGVPLAYLGFTGMSDGTCPWVNDDAARRGGKYCVLQHAEDNGCTIPGDIMTTNVGSRSFLCYDFEGCDAGYPVKVCTFDGGHTPSSVNDGNSTGDDGLKAFIPPLAWEFISQF